MTNTNLLLFHYWRSSCSWRVRWALRHKGVVYDEQTVNLLKEEQRTPSFLALNPGGSVPAIRINTEIFGESLAILEWIEESYVQRPLLPSASLDRLRVRQFCQMIGSGIQPLQNLSVMKRHSSDPDEQTKWNSYWIANGLHKLEKVLADHAGSFSFGGELTLADLCLVPQVYNALRFNVDISQFSTINRVYQNCLLIPECDAAAPHRQQGATPH